MDVGLNNQVPVNQDLNNKNTGRTFGTRIGGVLMGGIYGVGFTYGLRAVNYFTKNAISGNTPIHLVPHALTYLGQAVIQQSALLVYDVSLTVMGKRQDSENDSPQTGTPIGIFRKGCWTVVALGEQSVDLVDRISSFVLRIHTCKEIREKKVAVSSLGYLEIFRSAAGKEMAYLFTNALPMKVTVLWLRASGHVIFGSMAFGIEGTVALVQIANRFFNHIKEITQKMELHESFFSMGTKNFKRYIDTKIGNFFFKPQVDSFINELKELCEENIEDSEEARDEFAKLPAAIEGGIDYTSLEFIRFYQTYSMKDDAEFRFWLDIEEEEDLRNLFINKSQQEEVAYNNLPRRNNKVDMGSHQFREYFATYKIASTYRETAKEGYYTKLKAALMKGASNEKEINRLMRKFRHFDYSFDDFIGYSIGSLLFFFSYEAERKAYLQLPKLLKDDGSVDIDPSSLDFIRYFQTFCLKTDEEWRTWLKIENEEDLRSFHIICSEEEKVIYDNLPKKENNQVDMSSEEFYSYFLKYGLSSYELHKFGKLHKAIMNSSEEKINTVTQEETFNPDYFQHLFIRRSETEMDLFLKLPKNLDGSVKLSSPEFILYYQTFSRKNDLEFRNFLGITTDHQFVQTLLGGNKSLTNEFNRLPRKRNGTINMGTEQFHNFYCKNIGEHELTLKLMDLIPVNRI